MKASERLLTVTEAAKFLGLAKATVYRMCQGAQLAHVRVGPKQGKVLVLAGSCSDYLASARREVKRPSTGPTEQWKAALESEIAAGSKPGSKPRPK